MSASGWAIAVTIAIAVLALGVLLLWLDQNEEYDEED